MSPAQQSEPTPDATAPEPQPEPTTPESQQVPADPAHGLDAPPADNGTAPEPDPPRPPPHPLQRSANRHAKRLRAAWAARNGVNTKPPRPPPGTQHDRRESEREIKKSALAFWRWLRRDGVNRKEVADLLGISSTRLRDWNRDWLQSRLKVVDRGRPTARSDRELRNLAIAVFHLG